MKKLFKALAVLAAVAALGFGFTSCSNDDDDDDDSGSSYVAKYVWVPTDGRSGLEDDVIFYESTFEVIDITTLGSYSEKETVSKGTYTVTSGDWTNGVVTLTATEGDEKDKFTGTCTITDSVLVFSDSTWYSSYNFTKQ